MEGRLKKIKDEQKQEKEQFKKELLQLQDSLKYTFEDFLSIIKFFILSPIEKRYITNIEKEIKRGEELDTKINILSDVGSEYNLE